MQPVQRDGRRITRKRPRKIWSCLECRRKKLQCDHALPACGRCTRAGSAQNCLYTDTASSIPGSLTSNRVMADRTERTLLESPLINRLSRTSHQSPTSSPGSDLARRLETIESKLDRLQASPTKTKTISADPSVNATGQCSPVARFTNAAYVDSPPVRASNSILLRGGSFHTRFNGNTCAISMAEHVPGLTSFTSDSLAAFPVFEQVKQYLNKSEARTMLTRLPPSSNATSDNLRTLLPIRVESDRLVDLYLSSFDYIYPVLHVPYFRQDYNRIWQSESVTDRRIIVVVLLVIAIAYCLTSASPSNIVDPEQLRPRKKATLILDGCEDWLRTRIQSYESLVDFQIAFLLLLGRQLNAQRCKRTWANAGSTLRIFLCAGLHRDPEQLSKETSPLEKEMRRRLWAAVAEFELQAAFEHGMPAEQWVHQSDTPWLDNRDETDLELVQPMSVYTKTSFLAISGRSLRLRHEVNSVLNNMHHTLTSSAASDYTTELKRSIQGPLAQWTGPSSAVACALLSIQAMQYVLTIHQRQLQRAIPAVEKQFSRFLLLEAAMQMIDSHKSALQGGSQAVEILFGDHVRIAISICHAYSTAEPQADWLLKSAAEHNAFRAMQEIIDMFSEKIMRFGGSRAHLWFISAADGLMKVQAGMSKDEAMGGAVQTYTKPFRGIGVAASSVVSSSQDQGGSNKISNKTFFGEAVGSPVDAVTGTQNEDASMITLDDLTGWYFDDFFDPMDFLAI